MAFDDASVAAVRTIAAQQNSQSFDGVGPTLAEADIIALKDFVQDAQPTTPHDYTGRLMYHIMVKEGWEAPVRNFAKTWVKNNDNLIKAAASVGRSLPNTGIGVLRGFCIFKMTGQGRGEHDTTDSLGMDDFRPQTLVFIALEDLNCNNGFFTTLEAGCAICIDSQEKVPFPNSAGGGIGVFLSLAL